MKHLEIVFVFPHVYLQGYEQVGSLLSLSVLDVPAADCSLWPPHVVVPLPVRVSARLNRVLKTDPTPHPQFATISLNRPPRGGGA